jgi:hypothetical protein
VSGSLGVIATTRAPGGVYHPTNRRNARGRRAIWKGNALALDSPERTPGRGWCDRRPAGPSKARAATHQALTYAALARNVRP